MSRGGHRRRQSACPLRRGSGEHGAGRDDACTGSVRGAFRRSGVARYGADARRTTPTRSRPCPTPSFRNSAQPASRHAAKRASSPPNAALPRSRIRCRVSSTAARCARSSWCVRYGSTPSGNAARHSSCTASSFSRPRYAAAIAFIRSRSSFASAQTAAPRTSADHRPAGAQRRARAPHRLNCRSRSPHCAQSGRARCA